MASSAHDSDPSLAATGLPPSATGSNESSFDIPATGALPVFDLSSETPLPELPELSHQAGTTEPVQQLSLIGGPAEVPAAEPLPALKPGQLALSGDVLMCGCPDCRAPMTVRLWLMVADCWQCGTSIELSEEQEREARRLLQQRERRKQAEQRNGKTPVSDRAAPHSMPAPAPAPAPATPSQPQARRSAPPATQPQREQPADRRTAPRSPETRPTPSRPAATRPRTAPVRRVRAQGVSAWIHEFFKMTPAWLVSLVFHMVLLTILGMLTFEDDDKGPLITLSTSVDRNVREGGDLVVQDPREEVDFDLPIPKEVDLDSEHQRQAIIKADQEAKELRLDPYDPNPNLPDLKHVKSMVKNGSRNALIARDPRVRVDLVKKEGGSTLTEAAVARGLRWMSQHQNDDGSWSLHAFNRAGNCRCGGHGGIRSDSAGTSLALLPFLGAGQTHLVGRYKESVSKGVRWLVEHQGRDGDLRINSAGNSGMYAHGQGAIVLCEAFLVSGDEDLRAPAQRAIDFIVKAQHAGGGWRYQPGQPGDTSVVGWQLMALQSARAASLTVPDETLELASHYLDSVASHDGSRYAYMRRNHPTPTMTAEALLCRMYLGWTKQEPALLEGIDFLADEHLPSRNQANIYYWYYGTQAFHHVGGDHWNRWNLRMRDILVNTQERSGHEAGSWAPQGPHASSGGRLYVTALATCTLEVYYRHLPIFRQIDLD